jgi:hypothetical protein
VTALYQAHALGLIRLAVVMLGDRPAAEDVVQEAFCGLYRRWHSLSDSGKALDLKRDAATGFFEYSTMTGKVTRILGRWRFGNVGALAVGVLWSDSSGRVLIGVVPDGGAGRVGVISGNAFTPLPGQIAAVAPDSGTW